MSFLFAGINEADFPAFPKNERQAESRMLGTDLAGNTAERPARWSDKIVFFRMSVAVFHYTLSIALIWPFGQVSDSAMRRGGLVWLSHTAQRSANGAQS